MWNRILYAFRIQAPGSIFQVKIFWEIPTEIKSSESEKLPERRN